MKKQIKKLVGASDEIVCLIGKDNVLALEKLAILAAKYHIPLPSKGSADLETAVKRFIENRDGYIVTIPELYNAIKNL